MLGNVGSDAFEPAQVCFLGLFGKDGKLVDAFDLDEAGGAQTLG